MIDCEIREMQIPDIPAIMELEKQLFSSPWSKDMFLQEINSGFAFVLTAKETGKILGYICGLLLFDEFNITNVGVAPEQQKQGFGEAMLKFIIARLLSQKCFKFFLEVRESNAAAIALYQKFGFEILGKRKKYYNHPVEDALMLGMSFLQKQEEID
ncbi:MAG: ribosomal-protein-alanine N-acetyltransferase [Candidatus Cloacimonadota bacterium]|nr:MAG: ribosomal-protein-alanine N-acetyltransferase [Candidatus Cloacimonadota bacterium]